MQANMNLTDSLQALADLNRHGLAFLSAFGVTWLVCAILWRKIEDRKAALATIFQGAVALPIALGMSLAMGSLGDDRPVEPAIDELSYLIGGSQMLGLPLVIYLFMAGKLLLVPFAMASLTSMHFVFYSWLYQTPVYIGMAVVIAIGVFIVMEVGRRRSKVTADTASLVCAVTGLALLGSGLLLQVW